MRSIRFKICQNQNGLTISFWLGQPFLFILTGLVVVILAITPAWSVEARENTVPENIVSPPVQVKSAIIQRLARQGAGIVDLGMQYGFVGWQVMRPDGQALTLYMQPGSHAVVVGTLFDPQGKNLTGPQLRTRRITLQSLLSANQPTDESQTSSLPVMSDGMNESLLAAVIRAEGFSLGPVTAPLVHVLIDPACGHCKQYWTLLARAAAQGKLQVRVIPLGVLSDRSRLQAAALLSATDPLEVWRAFLAGEKLPEVSVSGVIAVERNMALATAWKLETVPLTLYRAADGRVRMIRGRPDGLDLPLK